MNFDKIQPQMQNNQTFSLIEDTESPLPLKYQGNYQLELEEKSTFIKRYNTFDFIKEEENTANKSFEDLNMETEMKNQSRFQKKILNKFKKYILLYILKILVAGNCMYLGYYLFTENLISYCDKKQYKDDMTCVEKILVPYISYWIKTITLCGFIFASILVGSVKNVFPKYITVFQIAQLVYMVFYIHDTNVNNITIRQYGGAQALYLGIITVVFVLMYGLLFLSYYLFVNYRKQFFVIIILLVLFGSFQTYNFQFSCYKWDKGLEESIDYGEQYCRVPKPVYCWPDILDGMLDYSPDSCSIKNTKEVRNKLFREWQIQAKVKNSETISNIQDVKYIGLPDTRKFDVQQRNSEKVQQHIVKQAQIYKTMEEAKLDQNEAVIDIQNLELNIQVNRDENLVKERQQIQNEGLSKNIIIVYIDTVSRTQMFRKMKKTMQFLKKYSQKVQGNKDSMKTDIGGKKYKKNKTVYEFFRFHSVDRNTLNNLTLMHWGYIRNEVEKALNKKVNEFKQRDKKQKSLFQEFKEAGYIVGHAMNTCSVNCSFRKYLDYNFNKYFNTEAADHEFQLLDPLYINLRNYFDTSMGINSVKRRCLYGKDTNEFVFDYGTQFLEQYKNEKKVMYLEFTDGHEITSEVLQYIDDPLYKFLNNLENSGFLEEDTTIYFLSDHGNHQMNTLSVFQQPQDTNPSTDKDVYSIERMLPMYYMLVTNDVLRNNQQLAQNLQNNSQKIFGMGEVRETMRKNAYGVEKYNEIKQQETLQRMKEVLNSENQSLKHCNLQYDSLYEELQGQRSCLDIGMHFYENKYIHCSCYPQGIYQDLNQQQNNHQQSSKKFIGKK